MSGCSAALFEPTLPDEQTKQAAVRMKTDSKRMEPPTVRQEVYFDPQAAALEASLRPAFMPPCFLDTRPAMKRIRFRSSWSILASKGSSFLINNAPVRDDSKGSSFVCFAAFGMTGGLSPSNIRWYSGNSRARANLEFTSPVRPPHRCSQTP